jgi:hypothetical protein
MARGTATYAQNYGLLSSYKAWAQPISGVLNAAQTRTNDTGQVNWATVPTEPTAVRDYEIFALGGPLQATAPIFLRFDYIGGSSAAVHITVGTTTDGAGNLGGLLVSKVALQNHLPSLQSNQYCWAACDNDSYFTLLYNLDPSVTGGDGVGMVIVERTRTLSGAASGAGFHVWRWQASAVGTTVYQGGWSRTFGATQQTAIADYNLNTLIGDLYPLNTTFAGTTAYAFPVYTYTPPFVKGASKAFLLGFEHDFPRGTPVTLTHYEQPMTFVPLGESVNAALPIRDGSNTNATKGNLSPLIRWD